jgi:hypothetical protein
VCSNQLCGISIRVNTGKGIAGKWIHRCRLRQPPGLSEARSIAGSENVVSGLDAREGPTESKGGSKLLIFVARNDGEDRTLTSGPLLRCTVSDS